MEDKEQKFRLMIIYVFKDEFRINGIEVKLKNRIKEVGEIF